MWGYENYKRESDIIDFFSFRRTYHVPEIDENKETSIDYAILWNQNEVSVDNFLHISSITSDNEDHKQMSIKYYRQKYWQLNWENSSAIKFSCIKMISQTHGNLEKSIVKEILQSHRQAKLLYYALFSLLTMVLSHWIFWFGF